LQIATDVFALVGVIAVIVVIGAGIGELLWRRTARRIKKKYPHCGW
jgi:hypothetical protein